MVFYPQTHDTKTAFPNKTDNMVRPLLHDGGAVSMNETTTQLLEGVTSVATEQNTFRTNPLGTSLKCEQIGTPGERREDRYAPNYPTRSPNSGRRSLKVC